MSKRLLTKILLRRLDHFGYSEEKLRGYNGGNYARNNKAETSYAGTKSYRIGGTNRIVGSQARASIKNANNNHNQSDNHGDITEGFKEATGAVKCLKEFTHNFFACKDTDFRTMGATKQWCFTALF